MVFPVGKWERYFPSPNFLLRQLLYSQYVHVNIPCLTFPSSNIPRYRLCKLRIFNVENERHRILTIGYVHHVRLVIPNPTIVKMSNSDYWRAQHFDRHSSRLCNSSCLSPSCNYQTNGMDIRLGCTNLWGILGGKRTIRYESISDILILMFLGIIETFAGS